MPTLPLISKYFPQLSKLQLDQLSRYRDLMQDWNEKVNLVSRKDMVNFEERHLLHSLSIAHFYPFLPGSRILDVGTGGGLPGIPLAIFFPDVHFTLVDSIGKKIAVVNDCIESIGLKNARAFQMRMENIEHHFDFVTNRAVAPLPDLYRWTKHLLRKKSMHSFKNGIIGLKGSVVEQESRSLHGQLSIHPLSELFEEEFFKEKVVYHFCF